MGLKQYKDKRSFGDTPEPKGGKASATSLTFVIQKHDASHLHYDFRLEMEGVLKSWAVPKGPSMDPKIKRLAMMVEDHPYDYKDFEGSIPKGNYGAGTVIVWDNGVYYPSSLPDGSKAEQDKNLRHQLHAGKVKFVLHGDKLKGEFALVKATGRGENSWLLMKLQDEFATSGDILDQDESVISGKSIRIMATNPDAVYGVPTSKASKPEKTVAPKKKTVAKKSATKKTAKKILTPAKKKESAKPAKGVTAKFPSTLNPMLATLVDRPFDTPGWQYEIKWDGYRALAFMNEGTVELKSRNDKSFNAKFYPIHDALAQWTMNVVLDGEIVVVSDEGISNFGALQNWRSEADGQLLYYVFDILWLNGKDLTGLPLVERKAILEASLPTSDQIRISDSFQTTGIAFFDAARQMGLEGIIAKKQDSPYLPGVRNHDWLKIKTNKRQEVVIGGFTNNEGSSKGFSALLVGVFQDGTLTYTGKIGTGFTDKAQKEMLAKFKPLITPTMPFSFLPDVNKPSRFRPNPPKAKATWLKPELVCEVSFTELTSDGVMRHPSFEGMRVDKNAKDVGLEKPEPTAEATGTKKKIPIKAVGKHERKTLLNPNDETQVREVDGQTLKFTNLSKLYWPEDNISKRDMLNYYYQMAPYILPYLKDRPQSLNRFPNGIHGPSFYQKDVTGKVPDWIQTYQYRSSDEDRDKHFMVASNEASVLYMATLGCIELNPWSSRIEKPDHPDWCIIDLDPDTNTFGQVIEAAQMTKAVLDSLNVKSYCKTSGSTGLHIYIPLGAQYTYEQSKEFARVIVTMVNGELPAFTSIARKVADRKGKIYLDFLQNRPKATLAAPYSLRPKPGATVSMPLHWEEVKAGLELKHFTIQNAVARVHDMGDLFKAVMGKGIDLHKMVGLSK